MVWWSLLTITGHTINPGIDLSEEFICIHPQIFCLPSAVCRKHCSLLLLKFRNFLSADADLWLQHFSITQRLVSKHWVMRLSRSSSVNGHGLSLQEIFFLLFRQKLEKKILNWNTIKGEIQSSSVKVTLQRKDQPMDFRWRHASNTSVTNQAPSGEKT